MSSPAPLAGQVALVTGASRGIGRAIALELAAAGAQVVVNYASSPDAAEAVVAEITAAGGEAWSHRADVADEEQVEAMVKAVLARGGRLDVLVNNAVFRSEGDLLDMTVENWKRNIAVNCDGPFFTCRAAVPHMIEREWGRIINFSGHAPFIGHYPAKGLVKLGIVGFTRGVATELGKHNITANCIAPGHIEVERDAFQDPTKSVLPGQAIQKPGTPDTIANMMILFAAESSFYITGQCYAANGGSYYL